MEIKEVYSNLKHFLKFEGTCFVKSDPEDPDSSRSNFGLWRIWHSSSLRFAMLFPMQRITWAALNARNDKLAQKRLANVVGFYTYVSVAKI